MAAPKIAELARNGTALTSLQAVAGKLWLANGGADEGQFIHRAVEAFWRAESGADPYWEYLDTRMSCDVCGERYKLENLSVCPNCFRVHCPREARTCTCGWEQLG